MTEQDPDSRMFNSSFSPRRKTGKTETFGSTHNSKDGSPMSKIDRMLNVNILVDGKAAGSPTRSRETLSATFNTTKDGPMRKKFNIHGGSALADTVSEQAEYSSVDGDGPAVKRVE